MCLFAYLSIWDWVGGAVTKPIDNRYRMTDNKILVTGSAGFIGYHLCKSLLNDNFDVLGIDNINDYYDVNLKKSRLNELSKNKNFIFEKINIADRKSLSKSFNFAVSITFSEILISSLFT